MVLRAARRVGVQAGAGAGGLARQAGARAAVVAGAHAGPRRRGAARQAAHRGHVAATGGQVVRALEALLVATAARGLQEARGREAEREATGDDRPGTAPAEVLEITQDRVSVRALQ